MKKFHKITSIITSNHETLPKWAEKCEHIYDEKNQVFKVKTWQTDFFPVDKDGEEEYHNRIDLLKEACEYDEYENEFDRPTIKYDGYVFFDEDFLEEVEKAAKKIHSYGAFAFSIRKELRKELKERLTLNCKDKREKNDKIAYIKQYA